MASPDEIPPSDPRNDEHHDDEPGAVDPSATPRGMFGRALRLGGAAARMGATSLGARMRGLVGKAEEAQKRAREVNAARLAEVVGDLRGVAMKLGQFASTQEDAIPDEFRDALSKFQSQAPPMVFPFVRDIVESELGGKLHERFASFDRKPLAAASLGQVHAAELPDGTPVAVKVQYPGIDETVRADIRAMRLLAKPMRLAGHKFDIREALDEVEDRLTEELDYEHEAKNTERCRELLQGWDEVVVPRVHASHSSRLCLTTDRLYGRHLDEWVATEPDQEARNEAGRRLGSAIWHMEVELAFLHADPHPGNFLFLDDGRIGLIDFGCVKWLSEDFLRGYRKMAVGLITRQKDLVLDSCHELSILPREDRETSKAEAYVEWGYLTTEPLSFDGVWPGDWGEYMERLHGRGRELAMQIGVWLPRDLVYLHRVTFGLMCFWKRLDSRINWHRLALSFLQPPEAEGDGAGAAEPATP